MTALSWNDKAPEKIMHATQIHPDGLPTYFEYVRVDVIEAENEKLQTNLRHWRDECGKLHSQISRLEELNRANGVLLESKDETIRLQSEEVVWLWRVATAARRLAYIVRKSVNAGPLSKDPTAEGQAWRALRTALGESYDEKGELV